MSTEVSINVTDFRFPCTYYPQYPLQMPSVLPQSTRSCDVDTEIRYQENKRFDAVPRQPPDIKCSGFKEKHGLKKFSTFESGESEFIFT